MTDKEIKEKYDDYVKQGRISLTADLITDEDWEEYYGIVFFGNTPSVLEMKMAIEKADERRQKAIERERLKNMSGKPRINIEF